MIKSKRLIPLFIVSIALFTSAQVYKWIDEKGNIHFGDRPPEEQQEVEEIALPEGPSEQEVIEAEERLDRSLRERQSRDAIERKESIQKKTEAANERLKEEKRFRTCVEAFQQLRALKIKARVFKLDESWKRTYLENEDRPQEIERLYVLVQSNCKTDPESQEKQYDGALNLSKGLNIKCVSAREKLAKGIDEVKKDQYLDYLNSNCPEVNPIGFWIVDWIPR